MNDILMFLRKSDEPYELDKSVGVLIDCEFSYKSDILYKTISYRKFNSYPKFKLWFTEYK